MEEEGGSFDTSMQRAEEEPTDTTQRDFGMELSRRKSEWDFAF